jgi:MoaF-like
MMPATRTAMASHAQHPDDFIAYPTNRVVGTIADPKDARAAVEALLQAGFAPEEIDILQEEKDLHRPDPVATDHRFLAQFQRTVIRTLAGDYKHLRLGEEYAHLRRYIDDVRAGRSVMMVLAKKREKREAAADILSTHGATFIEFYGKWSWQPLEPHGATPGRTYEIDLGGTATHVRLDSASTATILRKSAGRPDLSHLPVTPLRPQLLMIAWQEADRTTNVHVYDFENGHAHAVVGDADGRVHRAQGTVRRVDQNPQG